MNDFRFGPIWASVDEVSRTISISVDGNEQVDPDLALDFARWLAAVHAYFKEQSEEDSDMENWHEF